MSKKLLILVAIVTSLLIASLGYFYYHNLEKNIHSDKVIDLTAIAQLKIDQLEQWRNERTADIIVFGQYEAFSNSMEFLLNNPEQEQLSKYIDERLLICKKEYGYKSIFIISPENKILFSTNSATLPFEETLFEKILKLNQNDQIAYSDFYFDKRHEEILYDFASPIFNDENELIASLIFRVDPADYLYPLIQSWPTPSKTSETLLIRKDKDNVLFLNELRHQKGTALKLTIPLTQKTLPAVMAVEGFSGIVEGKDYTSTDVVAYIAPVPGTNWFMVSKIDKKELFHELVSQGLLVFLTTILIIITLAFGFGLIYNLKQKKIYASLWKTQEEFKTTLYSIGDAVITTDKDGKVKQINTIAEKLTGWTEKKAKSKPLNEVFQIRNEFTREKVENPVEKVLMSGEIVGLANSTILIAKDGKETPIADSAAPIRDNEENIIGVVLVFRDQTDEKRHLNEIESARDFAESIIGTLHESLLVLDSKFQVISANQTFYDSFNTNSKKVLKQSFFEIEKGVWGNKDLRKQLENILPQNTNFDDLEINFQFKNIGRRVLNMNARTINSSDNKTKNILLAINDITDKQKLIEELIIAKEKAEESNQLKTAFLANMSHEIRTPLNGILGFSGMIAEDELSKDERQKYQDIIENSGQRLLSIVNDILDISMIQSNQIKIKKQEFLLTEFLNEIYTLYNTLNGDKIDKIDFSIKNELKDQNLVISSDKDRLFQIFKNLLDNAFKFTQSGLIHFGTTVSNGHLTCFVKDSGKGIPADKVELIFEKFQQINYEQSMKVEGTGLGLSIAKGLVERLGGKIWVETEPEKGTTFFFELPLN